MLRDITLNELLFGNIHDYLAIKVLVAYNVLIGIGFVESYLRSMF